MNPNGRRGIRFYGLIQHSLVVLCQFSIFPVFVVAKFAVFLCIIFQKSVLFFHFSGIVRHRHLRSRSSHRQGQSGEVAEGIYFPRKPEGVIPVTFLKRRVKWCGNSKPNRCAVALWMALTIGCSSGAPTKRSYILGFVMCRIFFLLPVRV